MFALSCIITIFAATKTRKQAVLSGRGQDRYKKVKEMNREFGEAAASPGADCSACKWLRKGFVMSRWMSSVGAVLGGVGDSGAKRPVWEHLRPLLHAAVDDFVDAMQEYALSGSCDMGGTDVLLSQQASSSSALLCSPPPGRVYNKRDARAWVKLFAPVARHCSGRLTVRRVFWVLARGLKERGLQWGVSSSDTEWAHIVRDVLHVYDQQYVSKEDGRRLEAAVCGGCIPSHMFQGYPTVFEGVPLARWSERCGEDASLRKFAEAAVRVLQFIDEEVRKQMQQRFARNEHGMT